MSNITDRIFKSFLIVGIALLGYLFYVNKVSSDFYINYLGVYSFYISASIGAAFFNTIDAFNKRWMGCCCKASTRTSYELTSNICIIIYSATFGLEHIYEWLDADVIAKDYLIQKKLPYLNLTFFIIRNIFYFIVFSITGYYYWKKSVKQDTAKEEAEEITKTLKKNHQLHFY